MNIKMKVAAIAVAAAIPISAVAAYAAVASPDGGAAQVTDPDVYACVNPSGGIDYLEFRFPIPHACWFPNEQLWRWSVNPTPGPTLPGPG